MKHENYREFSSFYDMKEWLKQGEFILPAVYKTLNDGKFYFDDVLFSKDSNAKLYNRFRFINGITFNSNGEASRVLSEHMDSNFVQKRTVLDKGGNEHHLNQRVMGYSDSINECSFNEFFYFKNYGSVVKDLDKQNTQNFHNIIFPRQFERSHLTTIIIPEGIEYIAPMAFYKCVHLTSVILPSTLKRIGRGAFKQCVNLKEIYIPENCEVIETSAFMSCVNLKGVTFSKGVKFIGNKAFYNTGISRLFLPSTVENIGAKAFSFCPNLIKVYIGENVHSMGKCLYFNEYCVKNKLNGTAFYKSPIEKFIVDKKNQNVKVGVNGELMIKRCREELKEGWMIIKVPYNFSGMYVADARATSMIKNLFENSQTGGKLPNIGNIGKNITGVNFNNISIVPKSCMRSIDIETIIMPHVHYMNYCAFDESVHIETLIIGTEEEDSWLDNNVVKFNITNRAGVNSDKIHIHPQCKVIINRGNITDYKNHFLWGPYFGETYGVIVDGFVEIPNRIDGFRTFESTNSDDEGDYSYTYAKMRITFKGLNEFHLNVGSSSEYNCDFLCVSQIDEDNTADVETMVSMGDVQEIQSLNWLTTTHDEYYDIAPDVLSTYNNIIIACDTNEHFIDIFYVKDGSAHDFLDKGFVAIPNML